MNEQIKTYFENLRENAENDAKKLSRGTLEAYWTYEFNLNNNSSEFECNELPWTTDMRDFVKTMREAGIETIAVTETSTALLENLHKLANQGCTIEGLCKVSRPDIWGKEKNTLQSESELTKDREPWGRMNCPTQAQKGKENERTDS